MTLLMLQSAPAIQGTCVTTLALLPGKALFAWPQTRSCILEDFGDGDSSLMRFWLFQENHQIRENPSIQIIYTHILVESFTGYSVINFLDFY
jgi:hypothetical protein